MQIRVLLFATLKDVAGQGSLTITLPGDSATVSDVQNAVVALHPRLAVHMPTAIKAINKEFASGGDPITETDEVAFFPPVSGGDGESDLAFPEIFRLADEPLDLDDLMAQITVPATGAICVFSGMVRGETQGETGVQQTDSLEYEAYEPMALAKMRQVAAEIRERYPLVQGIAIVQRVGKLAVGQNTILIACGSGHRDGGCFEGARYGIDRLKEIVPVWKKETGADGASWIEGGYLPDADDRRASS